MIGMHLTYFVTGKRDRFKLKGLPPEDPSSMVPADR